MRKKQKGGVIVLSKNAIVLNWSMQHAIGFFVENSQISLLTKNGAEGIILSVQLNPGVESPFMKLNNTANPFDDDNLETVRRLIMKINLLNDVPLQSERFLGRKENRITPFKKRTITKQSWESNIAREREAFERTFNGVESLVPTIIYSSSYNKSNELDGAIIEQLFKNVDDKLTFASSEIQMVFSTHTYKKVNVNYNLKEQLMRLPLRVQEIGICFYEIIDNAKTVWDFLNKEKQPLDQKYWVYSGIFAKLIQMLEKGVLHGDHHDSNSMVVPPEFVSTSSFVQFIDFARCHFIQVPEYILAEIRKIKTSSNPVEISIATITCLNFIYDKGYFDDTRNSVVGFNPTWDMYKYIKNTIRYARVIPGGQEITIADIKHANLAVEVSKVIKKEEHKKSLMTAHFLKNIKLKETMILHCDVIEIIDKTDKPTLIQFILQNLNKLDHHVINEQLQGLSNEQLQGLLNEQLQGLSNDELVIFFKELVGKNPELEKELINNCAPSVTVNWSSEFIEMCRIKIFESEQQPSDQKVGGNSASAAGGGGGRDEDEDPDESSFGGSKKRKTIKQHGGGAAKFSLKKSASNNDGENLPTVFQTSKIPLETSAIGQNLPSNTEWINHYYKMDFEKTQEQINQHFAKHNYFAGIIIILIKLGIIGNNPPSIMLKTEKTKAIINNAVLYYQELDTILNGNQTSIKTKSKTLKTRSKSTSSKSLRPRSKSMKNVGLAKAKQSQHPYKPDIARRALTMF